MGVYRRCNCRYGTIVVKLRRVRVDIQFDGRKFFGWQRQRSRVTIQSEIERALSELAGKPVTVVGCSRTDAGVSARRYVFHAMWPDNFPASRLAGAVERLLPSSIGVLKSKWAPEGFHARYSAISKTYRYHILCGAGRRPLDHPFAWNLNNQLDVKAMNSAFVHVLGKYDFSSFCSSGGRHKNPVLELKEARVTKHGRMVVFVFSARNFLNHMIRNLVGAAKEVGLAKADPVSLLNMLNARDRRAAGLCAPAEGLVLWNVDYPA